MRGRLFVTCRALLGFLLMASAPLRGQAADPAGLSEMDKVLLGETTYQPETNYTPKLVVYPASISKTVELGQPIPADTLQVSVDTTQSAAYTVSPDASATWLSVLPNGGTATNVASNLSANYDITKMATETTYNANITFSAPSTTNQTVVVPVSIQVTAGIKVTAPAVTGVVWTQNQSYNISWSVGSSAITSSYFQILKSGTVIYTESVPHLGTGTFTVSYKVPYSMSAGTDYTVKVTGTGSKTLTASSPAFTIQQPPVWMEYPNGGETFYIGQPITLKWRLNNPAAGLTATIKMYRHDLTPTETFTQVGSWTQTSANAMGSLNITVPDVGVGGGQCLFKVISTVPHTANDPNYEDVSDDYTTITDPVRVTSPNTGAELWYIDGPATVTWKTNNPAAAVYLEIWDTSKTPNVKVADLGTGTGGSKTFIVPPVPYNLNKVYKIRAVRTDNASWSDLSDKAFTIVWPYVKVKSPNGGETFYNNKTMVISWDNEYKALIGDQLAIKLTNGTTTWTLGNIYPGANGYNAYGSNSYFVPVPANAPTGSNYKIKIESVAYPKVYYDWSDQPFSIHPQPIQVISPNGGEKFFLGRPIPIHWKTFAADAGSQVTIELWRGFGTDSRPVTTLGVDSSAVVSGVCDHTVNITIPDWLWTGTDFQIHVISDSNPALDDFSDGYFELTTSPINVLSPSDGGTLITGKTALFEWRANLDELGGKNYVKCELMQNGSVVKTLGTAPDGKYTVVNALGQPYMYGTYYWTVPSVPAGNYTFRVTSVDYPSFYDESAITVHDPPVLVLNPQQGEVVRAGVGYRVNWRTYIPDAGTSVKMELWRPSGKVADLGTDTRSAGSGYLWLAAFPAVDAHDDYFIRAYSVSNPALYGDSPWGKVPVNGISINKGFTIAAAPAKPQGLTAVGSTNQINLAWYPNSEPSIVAYRVYRATSANPATAIQIGTTDQIRYIDSANLSKGATYYYWVTAVNSYGQESLKSDPAFDNVGVVDLLMPTVRVAPGKLVYVHVNCPDATGILGNRLNITVNYNAAVFTPVRFEYTPLTNAFRNYGSTVSVTGSNGAYRLSPQTTLPDVPLAGSGRLFDLVFQVKSGVTLGDYYFSFGTNTALYGPGATPVKLTVNLTDLGKVTVAAPAGTGLDARYCMGDVTGDGKVDSADITVAMGLIHGVPTQLQMLAGDVNGDGMLDILDVQLIMLLAQGKSINSKPLLAAPKAVAPRAAGTVTTYTLTLPSNITGDTSDTVNVPVNVNLTNGLTGMTLVVNYDKSVLDFAGAITTPLTSGFSILPTSTPGQATVDLVGTTGISAPSGAIAMLQFKIRGVGGDHSALNIATASLIKGTGLNTQLIPSPSSSSLVTIDGNVTVVKRSAISARRWNLFE